MQTGTNTFSRLISRTLTLLVGVLAAAPAPTASAQTGPIVNEVAKLIAADGATGDVFGSSVAISGDTAVIGAPYVSDNGPNSGSTYVFVRDANGMWTQQAKLLASEGASGDLFGFFVAISGDSAIIGAPFDDDNGSDAGSAYVFTRDANGMWTQQAKLLATDGAPDDNFGRSVTLSGDTAVVGAWFDGDNGPMSGSAYVFVRDGNGVWTLQSKLLASDGAAGDLFGFSVALNGDTAVIGARRDDDACPTNPNCNSGSAYAFVRDAAGVWTQQAKLLAADEELGNEFGFSVALSGDAAVIGAFIDNDNGMNSGSAYAFVRDAAGVWTQQAKLLAADGAASDEFGWSVAISGDTAVVGALDNFNNAMNTGSAYVFAPDAAGLWTQREKLDASDGVFNDYFGFSVAISGATVVVGSPNDDDACFGDPACDSGSAYVFELPAQGSSADLNGDGVVDGADLASLLTQWGTDGAADLNGDGVVDGTDLATLLTNWGPV